MLGASTATPARIPYGNNKTIHPLLPFVADRCPENIER